MRLPVRVSPAGPIVLASWLACLACAPERAARPDLLLITIDTARADRFSFAGPSPVETAAIDSVAAEAVVFTQAVCPAPITLVSHASLLTGQLPITHGIRNNGSYRLHESATTLAELLSARGYRTGAFVGASVLASDYGLDQGFEYYGDDMGAASGEASAFERRAEQVIHEALGWLGTLGDEPAFVWVHLFDPHHPWSPPAPERSRHRDAPYDGEIAYVDRQVGELVAGYRALGRWDDATVVLTADHGESLGEHGEASHGVFLYDATMHVPLFVRVPGLEARVVPEQVQLTDVLPTLASLLGLEEPDGLDGRDLTPLLEGRSAGPVPPAYLESFYPMESYGWSPLRGVRSDGFKLIVGVAEEAYDLRADPRELEDVAARRPESVRALRQELRAFRDRTSETDSSRHLADDELEALRALGYASPSAMPAGQPEPAVDPRLLMHTLPAVFSARDLFERGFVDEALSDLQRARETDPGSPWVHELSVKFLRSAGRIPEAEQVCDDFLARATVRGGLGQLCTIPVRPATEHESQRPAAVPDLLARLETAAALAAHDDSAGVRRLLTEVTRHRSVGSNPPSAPESASLAAAANRVGELCWEGADFHNAMHAFNLAAAWLPEDARLHFNLGLAWERVGTLEKALASHRTATALDAGLEPAARHVELVRAEIARRRPNPPPTE